MRVGYALLSAAALLIASASHPSFAADCTAPCAGYAITAEVQNDWIFAAEPLSRRWNDLGPTIDTEFYVSPIDHLTLITSLTTEEVLDNPPGENRTFGDLGTYIEKLYAEYEADRIAVRLGKFNPQFGLATDVLDGIYATDQVDGYDEDQRWGVEAAVNYEAFGLSQSVTANAFTTDRTFLSESLFTNRGRELLSNGGAGNAEGLATFGITVDGCKGAAAADCFSDGQFGYRVGFRYQKAGHRTADQRDEGINPRDELGYLLAGTWRHPFESGVLRMLGEAAYFQHFEDGPDDALIATASASFETGPMTYLATYSRQENLVRGGRNTSEDLVDVTARYAFAEGSWPFGGNVSLGPAYRYSRTVDDGSTHTFGFVLTLDLSGHTRGGDPGGEAGGEESSIDEEN